MSKYMEIAEKGIVFVLTEEGYNATPERVKVEREVGKPIKGFEEKVPNSWLEKGYVRAEEWKN